MDRVFEVRPADLDATVQAGVGWQDLNEALKPHGLFFAVDPGTYSDGCGDWQWGTMRRADVGVRTSLP